jgi:coproporphyrinogen III oxidase
MAHRITQSQEHSDYESTTLRANSINPMPSLAERVTLHLKELQDSMCTALERIDGRATFREDSWDRPGGGGGRTRVMQNGAVFEKAGVNFSEVQGEMPERLRAAMQTTAPGFFATGVSLVLHPASPMVPTVHANYRYFETSAGDAWFGGGADFTPYVLFDEDAVHFHRTLKAACDKHGAEWYPKFKKWCDEYFYIKHRGECRGLGGIFFDYQRGTAAELEQFFPLWKECGEAFLPSYLPVVERRKNTPFTDQQKRFQLIRRGRYVEFNLVYDRGTLFGLETNGRIESILMSLPLMARWEYDHKPEPGTEEERLMELLRKPREWA